MTNNEPSDASRNGSAELVPLRTVPKATFLTTVCLICLLMQIGEFLFLRWLASFVGWNASSWWVAGFVCINLPISLIVADRFYKLLGLSRSGKSTEVRSNTQLLTHEDADSAEPVTIRVSQVPLVVISLVAAAVMAVVMASVPSDHLTEMICGYLIIFFFGSAGLYFIYEQFWGEPNITANATGLTCFGNKSHRFKRGFFPWADVCKCEITRYVNTWGQPSHIALTLHDWNGKKLVDVNLFMIEPESQEELVRYIKTKLSQTKPND